MARQASTSKPRKATTRKREGAQGRKAADSAVVDDSARIIDSRHRSDIAGVVFIIVAIVLLLIAVLPSGSASSTSSAVVTNVAGDALHLVFGVGCYILPFFVLAIGATFIVRFGRERVSTRAVIGLAIIFVALLGFIAMFTPVTGMFGEDLGMLFEVGALTSYGGYVGAAIAWVGFTLFGQVISLVILAGLMIVGVIVIGFSLSRLIERIRANHAERARNAKMYGDAGFGADDAPAFARIRRADDDGADVSDEEFQEGTYPVGAETGVLVSPVHPLATPEATQSFQPRGKVSKRPRNSGQLHTYSSPGTDVTQRFDAGAPAGAVYGGTQRTGAVYDDTQRFDALPTYDNTVKLDEIDASLDEATASPMTRKLAKPAREADDADAAKGGAKASSRAKSSRSSSFAASTASPHPQEGFVLPPMSLLKQPEKGARGASSTSELEETALQLQNTLEEFGVMAKVVDGIPGPTVTLFLVDLPPGVRVSRVTALNDDIALALAAPGVRIFAPVPGTNYVGIEVPNHSRQTVLLSEVLADAGPGPLQIAIGKDVEGHSIVSDLAKMPHLLIGGTTGSGKSVAINAMIMSILMRATPSEVRFIMIDPKRVEFTPYNGIPHLYVPVVTEAKEAASALAWGVAEMERRLKVFSKAGVRNIGQFNAKAQQALEEQAKAEAAAAAAAADAAADSDAGSTAPDGCAEGAPDTAPTWEFGGEMPYIVIVIDELSDLMMNVGKEVEFSISRIAQLARAAGIHLIVATQRPSTNVVTGLIKANITNRIAFNVASGIDSRVILDTPGAENLIGLGDMLYSKPEYSKPLRVQGCYVSEDEINAVVSMIKEQGEPEYHNEILSTNIVTIGSSSPDGSGASDDDPLLWEAADLVVSSGLGSTSNIQRRLKVGYSRAGRIMDQLEEKGIVSAANGQKPREVLVDPLELETLRAFEENDEANASPYMEG